MADVRAIEERVADELQPMDMEAQYREMLDDCYSFDSVGGPFAHMSPSRVLEEVDPVAFRCGFNDWIDAELGETIEEIGGEYYDKREVEDLKKTLEEEQEA